MSSLGTPCPTYPLPRLVQSRCSADIDRGRRDDDQCKPCDHDGNPKSGRTKREFGGPEPKVQVNVTDPVAAS